MNIIRLIGDHEFTTPPTDTRFPSIYSLPFRIFTQNNFRLPLERSQSMLDRAATFMPAMTVGRDWTIRQATACACDLLGKESPRIIGRPVGEILGLDVELIEARKNEVFDIRCDAPSPGRNGVLPLRLRGEVLADAPCGVHAVFCLIDLSGERQAAAEIQALSAQLHHVWRLNSLGEMAAVLAHELNQPLTAAAAYLHSMESDLEKIGLMGQSAARTAALAKGQILRTGEIIRRIRNLLSTEAAAPAPERLSVIMDDLAPVLQILARYAGARLAFQIERTGDEVPADRTQLQQVITNLVRNGIEAAILKPSPQVRVTGKLMKGGAYRVCVEYSGCGIPNGDLDALVRPLVSTKPGGMGLGLSITRTLLGRHGSALRSGTGALGGAAVWFDLRTNGGEQGGQ